MGRLPDLPEFCIARYDGLAVKGFSRSHHWLHGSNSIPSPLEFGPRLMDEGGAQQDSAGQSAVTVLVVLFGALLAYFRFFAYGFVLYLADIEANVDVLPLSKQKHLHFLTLKVANRGTFRLRIESVHWEAIDYPIPTGAAHETGTEISGISAEQLRRQVIDRGEAINLPL